MSSVEIFRLVAIHPPPKKKALVEAPKIQEKSTLHGLYCNSSQQLSAHLSHGATLRRVLASKATRAETLSSFQSLERLKKVTF